MALGHNGVCECVECRDERHRARLQARPADIMDKLRAVDIREDRAAVLRELPGLAGAVVIGQARIRHGEAEYTALVIEAGAGELSAVYYDRRTASLIAQRVVYDPTHHVIRPKVDSTGQAR